MNKLAIFALGLLITIGLAGVAMAADSSEKSVTGNLEDAYCYGTMGAKGAGHKQCAIKCASAGIPVTLIEKSTEKPNALPPNKTASPLPPTATPRINAT